MSRILKDQIPVDQIKR